VNHLKFGQQLYWIYTEGKSLIMKLGPGQLDYKLDLGMNVNTIYLLLHSKTLKTFSLSLFKQKQNHL